MPLIDQFAPNASGPIDSSPISSGAQTGAQLGQDMINRQMENDIQQKQVDFHNTQLKAQKSQYLGNLMSKIALSKDAGERDILMQGYDEAADNMGMPKSGEAFKVMMNKSETGRSNLANYFKQIQNMTDPQEAQKFVDFAVQNVGMGMQEAIDFYTKASGPQFKLKQAAIQNQNDLTKTFLGNNVNPATGIPALRASQADPNDPNKAQAFQSQWNQGRIATGMRNQTANTNESIVKGRDTAIKGMDAAVAPNFLLAERANRDLIVLNKPKVYIRDVLEAQRGITRLITGKNNMAESADAQLNFKSWRMAYEDFWDKAFKGKESYQLKSHINDPEWLAKHPELTNKEVKPSELDVLRDRTERLGNGILNSAVSQHEMLIKNHIVARRINQQDAANLRQVRNDRIKGFTYLKSGNFDDMSPGAKPVGPPPAPGSPVGQAPLMTPQLLQKARQQPRAKIDAQFRQALSNAKTPAERKSLTKLYQQIIGTSPSPSPSPTPLPSPSPSPSGSPIDSEDE